MSMVKLCLCLPVFFMSQIDDSMNGSLPGILGALTNVLLLIYTSTQYSGWSATEKAGCTSSHNREPFIANSSMKDSLILRGVLNCFDVFWMNLLPLPLWVSALCPLLIQIVFFVFLEHVIFGAKQHAWT